MKKEIKYLVSALAVTVIACGSVAALLHTQGPEQLKARDFQARDPAARVLLSGSGYENADAKAASGAGGGTSTAGTGSQKDTAEPEKLSKPAAVSKPAAGSTPAALPEMTGASAKSAKKSRAASGKSKGKGASSGPSGETGKNEEPADSGGSGSDSGGGTEEPGDGQDDAGGLTLSTSLTDQTTANAVVSFTVSGTQADGTPLEAFYVTVRLNGTVIRSQSTDSQIHYRIDLSNAVHGQNTVTITATDDSGATKTLTRTITYTGNGSHQTIGTASVSIRADVLGLGTLRAGSVPVQEGDTAASAVVRFLRANGIAYRASGSESYGFYLSGIRVGVNATISEEKKAELESRGYAVSTAPRESGWLQERDFTSRSGWLYSVNGTIPSGTSMSGFQLTGSVQIQLIFTLGS